MKKFSVTGFSIILLIFAIYNANSQNNPYNLKFRRQAVQRMVFDRSQNIPLSGFYPAKVVGLDIMHPLVEENGSSIHHEIKDGELHITSQKSGSVNRWIGGFNPFAVYEATINSFFGTGAIGFQFRDSESVNSITVKLIADNGIYQSIHCDITKEGNSVQSIEFPLSEKIPGNESVRLIAQMVAVGLNLYIEKDGKSTLIGRMNFARHFDLRRKDLMHRFEFCLHTSFQNGGQVMIDQATAFLSPGIGQSDMRIVTYEDGSPYFKEDRLWILITVRGGGLPHPMQGVYSLNPSVFDIRFEGIILYDRGDGLLRNDLASNIFYDRKANEWRGFTTGFSSYGDPNKKEKKEILAVQSSKEPLKGISIMKAKSIGLVADYEDPQCIYDSVAQKWRMLLCENHKGYKAVIRESDEWDGLYKLIAGPVKVNSTGTQLQKIGGKYHALFGSSDRKVYIYSYPDLQPVSELNIHRPPWDDNSGTRIWPNVIPLPEGYSAPYIALMMDRLNFPGMKGDNWTYGAMYLYYGFED